MQIVTARLILRPARKDDLMDMHAVLSDPRAMTWWSSPPHDSLDQTADWLDSMLARGASGLDFVIEIDGRVIGKAGFWKAPELGYVLHPDWWGRGLAQEAVGAAIDHLFRTTDFGDATADVDPSNAPSIRLLERLGFKKTGFAERTWNVGGVWCDSFYYGLSRGNWIVQSKA